MPNQEGRQGPQRARAARVLPMRSAPLLRRVPTVLADEEAHRDPPRRAARLPTLRPGRHPDVHLRRLREDRHHRWARRRAKGLPELPAAAPASLRLLRAAEEDRREHAPRPALLRLSQSHPPQRRALPRMRAEAHPRVSRHRRPPLLRGLRRPARPLRLPPLRQRRAQLRSPLREVRAQRPLRRHPHRPGR